MGVTADVVRLMLLVPMLAGALVLGAPTPAAA